VKVAVSQTHWRAAAAISGSTGLHLDRLVDRVSLGRFPARGEILQYLKAETHIGKTCARAHARDMESSPTSMSMLVTP
jgi:hypothetical protein